MANSFQSFLDWFSANSDALSKIGFALVTVIGGLWTVYLYVDGKSAKQKLAAPTSSPISGNVRIELVPSTGLPPTAPRSPLIAIEGRYRIATNENPKLTLFGCAFLLFWCSVVFLGVGSSLSSVNLEFPNSLVLLPFILVPLLMIYGGMVAFMSQVTLFIGKARVYVDADMILISRSLGPDLFSNHTFILASEWRFDGEVLVSRKDGNKVPVPELPGYVRSELVKALSVSWQ
jgi:hypothetical protein